jgi:hypothetical protein
MGFFGIPNRMSFRGFRLWKPDRVKNPGDRGYQPIIEQLTQTIGGN